MEESINAGSPSATSDLEPEEVLDTELADDIICSERELGGEEAEKMRRCAGRLGDWMRWRRWS
jgi:hypothetical protein